MTIPITTILGRRVPEGVERNADLSGKHSLGLQCRAWALGEAESPEHLARLIAWAENENKRWRVIGGGTNIFFANDQVDAVVIRLGRAFLGASIDVERGVLRCGASTTWRPLIMMARAEGFGGLEYGWRIPGTIGGALAGNAGAAGRAICEDVIRVRAMSARGEIREFLQKEIQYEYRRSSLGEWIILNAELRLEPATYEEIDEKLAKMDLMRETQPRGIRSAGCFFRNPAPDAPAGRLIDECGLKGANEGQAAVSDVHANFLVNRGGATPAEMLKLMHRVRSSVMERAGLWLQPEVRMI
jgi:UDP-N-acetylmuramate dehydrogenase